ncbi:MAG: ribbon-helix-helix protein, CopG family [Oceanicaulis sp.]
MRLPEEVETRLSELAGHTRRSKSYLAREAITAYVERELAIVAGVEEGLDDLRAGRVVPHDEAMSALRSAVSSVQDGE